MVKIVNKKLNGVLQRVLVIELGRYEAFNPETRRTEFYMAKAQLPIESEDEIPELLKQYGVVA